MERKTKNNVIVEILKRRLFRHSLINPFICFLASVLGIAFILAISNVSVKEGLIVLVKGAIGSKYAFSEMVVKAIPIGLCALAVVIPAKAGLINLGGEGQFCIGAIATVYFALLFAKYDSIYIIPLIFIITLICSGLWGLIPALFRLKYNVSEVLSSLLLNYVALLLIDILVYGPMKDPNSFGWPYSENVPSSFRLSSIFGTRIYIGIGILIVASGLAFAIIRFTSWGYKLRVLGINEKAAIYSRIPVNKYYIVSMVLGGMLAGIAGWGELLAIEGRLQSGISGGVGFAGFLVACLSQYETSKIIYFSLFIAGILNGCEYLQIFLNVPYSTGLLVQGCIFVAYAAFGVKQFGRKI